MNNKSENNAQQANHEPRIGTVIGHITAALFGWFTLSVPKDSDDAIVWGIFVIILVLIVIVFLLV